MRYRTLVVGVGGFALLVIGLTVSSLTSDPMTVDERRERWQARQSEAEPRVQASTVISACRDEMRRQLTPGMPTDFPFMHDIDSVRESAAAACSASARTSTPRGRTAGRSGTTTTA